MAKVNTNKSPVIAKMDRHQQQVFGEDLLLLGLTCNLCIPLGAEHFIEVGGECKDIGVFQIFVPRNRLVGARCQKPKRCIDGLNVNGEEQRDLHHHSAIDWTAV